MRNLKNTLLFKCSLSWRTSREAERVNRKRNPNERSIPGQETRAGRRRFAGPETVSTASSVLARSKKDRGELRKTALYRFLSVAAHGRRRSATVSPWNGRKIREVRGKERTKKAVFFPSYRASDYRTDQRLPRKFGDFFYRGSTAILMTVGLSVGISPRGSIFLKRTFP